MAPSMLSEMRKFGLKLGLAHQYIHQIDELPRHAILAIVAHKVIFAVHHLEAEILACGYDRPTQPFNCFGCRACGDFFELVVHNNRIGQKEAALAIKKKFCGYEPAKKGLPKGGLEYLEPDH